jgi:hypothetical protein
MCACCEATCVVLELTFVKRCLLFFVYCSCSKKETDVRKRSKKVEEKSRELIAKKKASSPLFFTLFFTHILQNFCSK